jgi:hypothetical protein
VGRLPLRMRLSDRRLGRGEMTCPAMGEATTLVPGVATGGGSVESERKRGWMCASLVLGVEVMDARRLDAGL